VAIVLKLDCVSNAAISVAIGVVGSVVAIDDGDEEGGL
jgi:hypothetical protein